MTARKPTVHRIYLFDFYPATYNKIDGCRWWSELDQGGSTLPNDRFPLPIHPESSRIEKNRHVVIFVLNKAIAIDQHCLKQF